VIPQGVEIFLAVEPIDMRLGFERLGGLARGQNRHPGHERTRQQRSSERCPCSQRRARAARQRSALSIGRRRGRSLRHQIRG
jgi:hypothetical protein